MGTQRRLCRAAGVGTKLAIEGRIQSREYRKKFDDGTSEMRKAYEVSVVKLEEI